MVSNPNRESSRNNKFPDPVFIGRRAVLAQLRAEFDNLIRGRGNFVVINGEAGIGKSAVLDQFLSCPCNQDALLCRMCFGQDMEIDPYLPFFRLIDDLDKIQNIPMDNVENSASLHHVQDKSSEFSNDDFVMQELHVIHGRQSQVQQQILSTLIEHAALKPLVIAVENAHLATQTAWQFFHYLADKCQEHPILFISTLRQDGQVSGNEKPPLYVDILQRMNRDGFVRRINLNRFSKSDIHQLLLELFKKTDFSGDFSSFLLEVSGGIPGQIMKYLKLLYNIQIL